MTISNPFVFYTRESDSNKFIMGKFVVENSNTNLTFRSFVFYWFLEGLSLFQAIEKHSIKNYVIYCRILFGMVKGLVYLQEKIG